MMAHVCENPYITKNSFKMTDFFVSDVNKLCGTCFSKDNIFLVSFNYDFDDLKKVVLVFLNESEILHSNLSTQEILISCPDFLGSFCQQTATVLGKEFGPLVLLVWK